MQRYIFFLIAILIVFPTLAAESNPLLDQIKTGYFELTNEDLAEEGSLIQYYIELGCSLSIVLGLTGVSVGSLMVGATCIGKSAQEWSGLCIAGISTATAFGLVFLGGATAAGYYLYTRVLYSPHDDLPFHETEY